MAGRRWFYRYDPLKPHSCRELFVKEYISKRPRRGWLGTGIGRERDPSRPLDNPLVQVLVVVFFATACFVASVPCLIVSRQVFR